MKRSYFITAVSILLSIGGLAQSKKQLLEEGIDAYERGAFESSIATLDKLIETTSSSPSLVRKKRGVELV